MYKLTRNITYKLEQKKFIEITNKKRNKPKKEYTVLRYVTQPVLSIA